MLSAPGFRHLAFLRKYLKKKNREGNFLLIAFVTVSILFACKKKDNSPTPSVVGFWKGKYGNGTAAQQVVMQSFLETMDP